MYRTFIEFSEDEREFLRGLQRAWTASGTSKKKPSLSRVLRAIVNDYRELLEQRGDPNFTEALKRATGPRFSS